MQFQWKLWRIVLTVVLLDMDTADQDVEFKVNLSWKKSV